MTYTVQVQAAEGREAEPQNAIGAILVGIDERPGWASALQTAGELAEACRAVLIVVDLRPALDPAGPTLAVDEVDHCEVLAQRFPRLVVRAMTARGHGGHTLLRLAPKVGADLVVVPEAVVQPRWRRPGVERRLPRGCPVVVVPA